MAMDRKEFIKHRRQTAIDKVVAHMKKMSAFDCERLAEVVALIRVKLDKEKKKPAAKAKVEYLDQLCSECGNRQFTSPSGVTCRLGHGEAQSIAIAGGKIFQLEVDGACVDVLAAVTSRGHRRSERNSYEAYSREPLTRGMLADLQTKLGFPPGGYGGPDNALKQMLNGNHYRYSWQSSANAD